MAAAMATALTYPDLEMSKVDAQLQRDGELAVVLSPARAQLLIALIEVSRELTRHPKPRVHTRLRLMLRGLWATFRAGLFHGRLMDLAESSFISQQRRPGRLPRRAKYSSGFLDDKAAI
jgi:hypothetical protein